ncbi:MAG: energy transducer TonB [Deltaproteobacteria bacterium]|mgnify:CR=1 FL=1|nr:energy transducer TonB [Deltaproteobacteria bacterium]RLB21242.1 MAG: hypothetical protein DRG76_09430 [Deltaproteobacteria bacterium]
MDQKAMPQQGELVTYSRNRKLMRACLITSFALHVVGLLTINRAFPIHWVMKPLKVYHVDLIRPPVKDLDLEKDQQGLAHLSESTNKPVIAGEDTISLDTTDKRYVSYAKVIKEALMNEWQYPAMAKDNLIEGQALVLFTLTRDGCLKEMKLMQSSGFTVLDNEAMRAIRAAAPFPAFPGSVTVARLHIKASFDYRLTGGGQPVTP